MSLVHDAVIVTIPAVLALGVLASLHPAVALHQGLAAGSLLSTLLLYEVLFRNPPVEPISRESAVTAAVGIGWVVTLFVYV